MRNNNHINMLPSVSVSKQINNLDVNRCYVIAPNGVNIRISHAKYSDIRKNYTKAIKEGQLKKCVVLNEKLTNNGQFYLTHIDYVKGKYKMTIVDCHLNERYTYDFEKDLVFYYTEKYSNQVKAYQKKISKNHKNIKVHGNKKRPDGYQREYNKDYGRADYAFKKHNDISLILSFKEKYPDSDAFADIIADYNNKQISQSETLKESTICINAEEQQYIKRIVHIFNNITTDETTLSVIINDYIKNGILKSRIDAKEVEKMKNEISEMENKISTMNKVLSLFS